MRDPVMDRKAKTIGLTGSVIRVLTEDHDPDPGKRGVIEGCENAITRWIDGMLLLFLDEETLEVREIRGFELILQKGTPFFTDPG
jgi:hypothetical protein